MFNKDLVKEIKQTYPKGTKVCLNAYLNDPYSKLTPGQQGIVNLVDDVGQIHVTWNCGSRLALIPGEDSFSKI